MVSFGLLLLLIWVHLFADFHVQDDFQATMKAKNNFILFVHSALWAGIISFVLICFGLFSYPKLFMLLVGHFIIDYLKCHKEDKTNALTTDLYKDQFLHLCQLLLCLL